LGGKLKDEQLAQDIAQRLNSIETEIAGFKGRLNAYWKDVEKTLENEIIKLNDFITKLEAHLAAFREGVSLLVLMI
jgi:septal ring factor EnvC (AmiA/AmiB activator)